jgi:hypothetical protein
VGGHRVQRQVFPHRVRHHCRQQLILQAGLLLISPDFNKFLEDFLLVLVFFFTWKHLALLCINNVLKITDMTPVTVNVILFPFRLYRAATFRETAYRFSKQCAVQLKFFNRNFLKLKAHIQKALISVIKNISNFFQIFS